MKYRTKPTEIHAIQWTGSNTSYHDIQSLIHKANVRKVVNKDYKIEIWNYLSKKWLPVYDKEYVLRGLMKEAYPCNPDVFAKRYEPVGTSSLPDVGSHIVLRGGIADGRIVDVDWVVQDYWVAAGSTYKRTAEVREGRVVYERKY